MQKKDISGLIKIGSSVAMSSGVGNLRLPAKAGQPSCYRSEANDLFVRGDLKTHFWRRLAVNDLLTSAVCKISLSLRTFCRE
ncbi:hypothetical protein CEXT_462311 [Caerostris extrusa]|uniref:Uncharacterized protein n=1 Tax=Caerostris extrusa TaxID=172846 RepID=A0AAV4S0I2_CAEEX|nr:hypothetical protein CEXT_462311 [Caerostris extrusa]